VYYFSYQNRIRNITTRLTNRAITTARLLSQSEIFDRAMVEKIDSSTTVALLDKTVQAYDHRNSRIYTYSDKPDDTLQVDSSILDEARTKTSLYFTSGKKDVIAYHAMYNNYTVVMVVGGIDEEGKDKLQQLRLILLFSFIGGLMIAVAGGYFFSGGLVRPIRKIADEVNEISAKSLARRINPGKTEDEWNYLSSTLNQLLNRLQESFEVQGRFIANASHELLTPLTSISSQLEVSLQRHREAGQYREVMQSIYQDVRHLSKLTQTLLEFAKASGNPGGIEIDLVRMDEILLRLPGEIVKLNNHHAVTLIFNNLPPEEEKLLVFGNEELLLIAVKNIVVNACKYSPDHKAKVTLDVNQNEVIVSISDKGPGIPQDELKSIFQPFYRVNIDDGAEGFGLGLSLTSRIIKFHKGHISVDSTLGQGTVFSVKLPAAGTAGGF
jgi:signal transduction histidine kinase